MDLGLALNINRMMRTGVGGLGGLTSDLRAQVIEALFGNGEQGSLIDWSDSYTDTAGSTTATAGDTVARSDSLIGTASVTEADAAQRPLLGADKITTDGVDDVLLDTTVLYSSQTHRLSAAAFEHVPGAARGIVLYNRAGASNLIAIGANLSGALEVSSHGAKSYSAAMPSGRAYVVATREIATAAFRVWVNGVEVTLTDDSTSLQSSLGSEISVSNRSAANIDFGWKGDIGPVMHQYQNSAHTADQIDAVNDYLANWASA